MLELSAKIVSLLRTAVPAAWGSLIAWLLTVATWLPVSVTDWLTAQAPYVTLVAIAGFYALARWVEPHLPAWLTRIVLGSNLEPTYLAPAEEVTPA